MDYLQAEYLGIPIIVERDDDGSYTWIVCEKHRPYSYKQGGYSSQEQAFRDAQKLIDKGFLVD